MATNRVKPTLSVTVHPEQLSWLSEQSAKRSISMSQLVSEAIALMRTGIVYQLDTNSLAVKATKTA